MKASLMTSGSHDELKRFLKLCEKGRQTPMIWGAPGIGKSEVVEQYGRQRAEEVGREFVIWHELTTEEKQELYRSEEVRGTKYIMYDNRAASNDSTDDKGIPNITNSEYLSWVQNLNYKVFEKENAMGILFNDEINLAPTLVQNSMYKMVYNRAVGDLAFSDGIFIVCAGNRIQDQAFVQETPLPLRTRMIHFQLRAADPEEQVQWFANNGIDPRLVAFFAKNGEKITTEFKSDEAEFTANCPRTVVMCSNLIKDLKYPDRKEDIRLCAVGAMSDGVGNLFIKFMDGWGQIDIDEFLENPKKAKTLENNIDAKYGLITLLASRYRTQKKKKKELLHKIADIFEYLDEEMGVLMMRMVKGTDPSKFVTDITQYEKWGKISGKIAPLIGGGS